MADNVESTLLARALRLQKSVSVDVAVEILSKDITTDYGVSPLMAKHMAIAALDGNDSLLKDLSSHINKKDKHYSIDNSKTVPTPTGSPVHVLDLVQSDKKHEGFEKKGEPPAAGDANPGVKKSDEDITVDAKARSHLEKAFDDFQKIAGPDCGHCNSSCSCGRGVFKQALGMFKADDKPEKKDDKGGDKKEGGSDKKKETESKAPAKGGGDKGVPPAPEELPMPATGEIAGMDGAAPMPPAGPDPMAGPMGGAPPMGGGMGGGGTAQTLMVAGQISDLVQETVNMINDLVGSAVPPPAPPMAPPPMDPMMGGGGPPPMPDTTPQFDPVAPGGAKGGYLEEEEGAIPAPKHPVIAQAHSLSKALNAIRGKQGIAKKLPDWMEHNAAEEARVAGVKAGKKAPKVDHMTSAMLGEKVTKEDAGLMTSTPGANHPVIDGSVKPKKPKALQLAKALKAARTPKQS